MIPQIYKKKKMLLTVICQKIWQPRRNGQVSKHNLSKLIQEEKDNLNRLITRRETESVISKTASNKSPRLEGLTGEFYQIYRELSAILLKLFQKTKEETKLPKLFYDTTVTLVPKPETLQKKENYGPIILMNIDAKILNNILAYWTHQHLERIILHDQVGYISMAPNSIVSKPSGKHIILSTHAHKD